MNLKPIGVFDSGLGGLTVVKEIRKVLPNENIIYLGDTARIPYGTRSRETVIKFALEDAEFLADKNVKCIVIACNTASALAFLSVKKKSVVPVFDVITSGSYDAVRNTGTKRIGVIGTRATIGSMAYEKTIKKIDPSIRVYSQPAPLLVPLIEEGVIRGSLLKSLLRGYLKDFKQKNIDILILGCTHYPIIYSEIKYEAGNIKLINPGKYLSQNLKSFLDDGKLGASGKTIGKTEYFVTDLTERFIETAEMFLGEKIKGKVKKINLG